ncbi:integrase/recombinase XerC [Ekhidna lutea]|uniref:Tyrosine recombinase XerC n=1 Tax=Ekhidna lutea TaxID=447679 RepID=A0A239F6F8_EKHLU|nr:tyrosine-type recombinase/integrase [Ekhidna lutea]SNS52395.1 integrase/recombinase XerC [Ekhidna lutea]
MVLLMVETFLKYLSFEKRYSPHTVQAYRKDLLQFSEFILAEFEISDLLEVKHIQIRGWVVSLMDLGISAKSVNRKIATLKSFYKFLLGREYIEQNPAAQIKPLKTKKELPTFVKEDEITNLLDRIEFSDDFAGQRDKLLLELLYSTGIRLAELQGLKETDVNFYENTIRVLGKRNKERIIPVGNSLVQLIRIYQNQKDQMGISGDILLVTDAGTPLYPMFIYRKVKKYLSAVTTLSKKSPHVLRHTFATHLLNKGADLNAVKDLLGHTSLAATQVYTHNSIDKLKAAFDQAHPKA